MTARPLEAIAGWLDTGGRLMAILCMLVMALSVTLDVMMRYFFNAPLIWVHDLVRYYLTVGMFGFVLSATLVANGHMGVDIIARMLPLRTQALCEMVSCLLSTVMFGTLGYLMVVRGLTSWQNKDVIMGPVLWPTWPAAAIMAFGAILLTFRLFLRAAELAAGAPPSSAGAHDYSPEGN